MLNRSHHLPSKARGRESESIAYERSVTGIKNHGVVRAHGISDRMAATREAIVSLGNIVKHQALIMGFSDTFAIIGILLALAAVVVLFARKPQGGVSAGAH
jgi:hypothetical protein